MPITKNIPNDDYAEMVAILRELNPAQTALVAGFALGLKTAQETA